MNGRARGTLGYWVGTLLLSRATGDIQQKGECVLNLSRIIHMSKDQPGTVEKNSSTIGSPPGIEPFAMPVQCS